MTNDQLYLAIGLPMLFNGLTTILLYVLLTKRIDDIQFSFNKRLDDIQFAFNKRLDDFQLSVNKRLDDMTTAWRDALLRVEQVMDARLKALEERRP